MISIHALREEGDTYAIGDLVAYNKFLSTPSARRATEPTPPADKTQRFLSTPSARRATGVLDDGGEVLVISIHALREEGDQTGEGVVCLVGEISIHALREEGDGWKWSL